jgi:gamma-glutamylcyclotransferase (GGCT)/AIG2-like uncharacterized protein YtfP
VTTRLFVYGTLMAGENAHRMLGDARFLGTGQTAPAYTLYQLGSYPALVEGGHSAVYGELFAVDEATLAQLDVYEGVPELYVRAAIRLLDGSTALTYVMPLDRVQDRQAIATGDWKKR